MIMTRKRTHDETSGFVLDLLKGVAKTSYIPVISTRNLAIAS